MTAKITAIPLLERPAESKTIWGSQDYTKLVRAHAAALRVVQYGNPASFVSDPKTPEPPLLTALGLATRAALNFKSA